jgi:hypothetical protein
VPWLKFAVLLLVVAGLGLPINDLFRYAVIVIASVVAVTGVISAAPARWLGALAVVGLGVLAQMFFAAPRIEEGHNVFLIDAPGGALESGLPADAFRRMAAQFDRRYPPPARCDPATSGCWRGQEFPERPFAFSADGILTQAAYSRRVSAIDFSDPVRLRLGFINEAGYNWNAATSDIDRASRDRRSLAFMHRWKLEMPWFVMYRFPTEFAGSVLCWRGDVLWEGAQEKFAAISHPVMGCRTLAAEDIGRRIFGLAIAAEPPLAMRLEPTAPIRFAQLAEPALAALTAFAVLALLIRPNARRTLLPFALISVTLALAILNDASFVGGVRPFDGGDDGLVYDGYARRILRALVAGDIAGALEGGEPVFYFTPGLRYLRAVEHIVFGESYLGYLSLMLVLPFLVFALFRRFLGLRWALALVLVFAAIPVGVLFGSSLVQYVSWASRGFADPAAYVCFLAALVLLVGRRETPADRFGGAFAAGLLFALALFLRPNLAPGAAVPLAGAGFAALWQGQRSRAAGLCLGFLPVLAMPLHNYFYGGMLVLFTSTAGHPTTLVMPPAAYLAALAELIRLDASGEHVARALQQIGRWLAGPSEHMAMAPLNAAALVIAMRVAAWRRAGFWLRLIAVATLAQHCVGLFYVTAGRYHYLTWLLTLLVVAAWLQREGIGLAQRKLPLLSKRIAEHPVRRALARGLERIVMRVGP